MWAGRTGRVKVGWRVMQIRRRFEQVGNDLVDWVEFIRQYEWNENTKRQDELSFSSSS